MRCLQTKIHFASIILLSIFFFSAFFPPETYSFSKALTTILIVLLGFQIFVLSRDSLEKQHQVIFMILLSFLLINMVVSLSPYRSASAICYYLQLFILFLVFLRFVSSRQLLFLMKGLIGIATALSIYGIYQRAFGFEHLASFLEESHAIDVEIFLHKIQSGRVFSTFVLPSSFAGYILLTAPITLFCIGISKRVKSKVFYSVCFCLQAGAFLLTFSLGALFALILSMLIIISLKVRKRKVMVFVSSFVIFLILASLFLYYRGIDPIHPFTGENPLTLRGGNWKAALFMFKDHPFFGVGDGSFGIAFSQYREPWMNESHYAHNSYLQILAENGLVSIPFLLAFAFAFLRHLMVRLKLSPFADIEMSGMRKKLFPFLAFSCLSWMIHNLIDFTFYHASVSFLFFPLLGTFFARGDLSDEERVERMDPSVKDNGFGQDHQDVGRGLLLMPFRALLAIILALVFLFSVPSFLSSSYFEKAMHLLKAEDFSGADRAVKKAEWVNPLKSEYRIFRAQLLMEERFSEHDLTKALEEAERAIFLDRWIPYYYHVLSDIQIISGKPLMAYISISKASELYPVKREYQKKKTIIEAALKKWTLADGEKEKNDLSSF